MNDDLAIGAAPVSAIAAEAASLRELFVQQCPALGRELAPVALEPEAPERVRAFWETFGWTSTLAERGWLSRPDAPSGRVTVRELLEDMREDDVELQSELPKRYRLVHVDQDGVGFAVTNEDGDPADPPVVAVISDTGEVTDEHSSYLNFCANQLVRVSFSGWHNLQIDFSNYEFAAAAEAPWPLLSPATRRLAPDLWLVPNHDYVVSPGPDCHLAYERLEAVTRWLMGLPEGQVLDVAVLPGEALRVASFAEIEALLDPGARSFPATGPGERIVVGTVEGRPVIVWQLPAICEVATEPSETTWLRERLGDAAEPVYGRSVPAPASGTPRDPLRDEDLAALDELVSELCPQHRATKRPVDLEPDAPERMRRLWDVLGDSHATAKVRVLSREESRAALERTFADWFRGTESREAWGAEDGPEAYFAALPARYRLLSQRSDAIAVTDETDATDDPPVLVMRRTESPVIAEYRSYVEWLIWELLTTVTWSRNAVFNVVSGIRGERILPSLYPQIERLGEGLYWMRMPRAETMPPYTAHIFYPSLDNYFRWVLELPDELIRFAQPPRARMVFVSPRGDWDVWRTAPAGFRRFADTDLVGKAYKDIWHAVGQVDGLYLWLYMHSEYDLFVRFDPRKEDEVSAILAAHELEIKGVIEQLKGYDEYGW